MIQDLTINGFLWKNTARTNLNTPIVSEGDVYPIFNPHADRMKPFTHWTSNVVFHKGILIDPNSQTGERSFTVRNEKYRFFRHCSRCGRAIDVNIQNGMFTPHANYDEVMCEECIDYLNERISSYQQSYPNEYHDNSVYFTRVRQIPSHRVNICRRWLDYLGMI